MALLQNSGSRGLVLTTVLNLTTVLIAGISKIWPSPPLPQYSYFSYYSLMCTLFLLFNRYSLNMDFVLDIGTHVYTSHSFYVLILISLQYFGNTLPPNSPLLIPFFFTDLLKSYLPWPFPSLNCISHYHPFVILIAYFYIGEWRKLCARNAVFVVCFNSYNSPAMN